MERLELRLQRVNVNVRSRLVRERAEDIDLGYASTCGIAAEGPVGSHAESKTWISGIAVSQSAATQCILNIGTWRRTDDCPWVEEAANARLRKEGSVLAHVRI